MALNFDVNDVKHKVVTKFIHAFLPEAKKPFNLKTVYQPVLDLHGVASKADTYNLGINPNLIEEGFEALVRLIPYLLADGYRIKTDIFDMSLRIPGEYDGSETHLPEGVFPHARLQVSSVLRKYLKEHTDIVFDGVEEADGYIAQVTDEATDQVDDVATIGNLLTIRGYGLKIEGDEMNKYEIGLFFEPEGSTNFIKADIIAVNEPRTLKVIVPALEAGRAYTIKIVTQSSARHSGTMLKETREIRSEFTLTAQ